MPRPSDVYATFGAPGVYQATSCTPSRLPNVYVFPPEEDNQDVYCLFHSGSASPTTFESFYSHPVYTQRDPNSPTLTDLTALDHALSYFQRQSTTHTSARYGPRRTWEHDGGMQRTSRNYPLSTTSSASSRSSFSESVRGSSEIEAETTLSSDESRLGEAEGQFEEQWECQSKSPSRRSSIFADRPPGYEVFKPHVPEDQSASMKPHTRTFRSRAALALKGLGNAIARRPDGQGQVTPDQGGSKDEPAVYESWLEQTPLRRKRSRRTLAQVLNPHVDIPSHTGHVDLQVPPTHSSSSVRDPKLIKRKSMTQLFGMGRTSMESGNGANSESPRPDMGHPAVRSFSSLSSSAGQPKLSTRRSVTQLWGLGRGASSTELSDHTIVAVDADEALSETSEASGAAASRSLEETYSCASTISVRTKEPDSKDSEFPASLRGLAAPPRRRKSFLSKRGFSFRDLQRHFGTDHGSWPFSPAEHTPPAAPAIDPSPSFSPDSLSEGTDSSSSVAASTDCERTTEEDMHFPVPRMSTIMGQGRVVLAKGFESSVLSRSHLDLDKEIEDTTFSRPYRLEAAEDDVGSDQGEDPPMLDLAVRLNSLTFDQLVFDPESFTGSFYD